MVNRSLHCSEGKDDPESTPAQQVAPEARGSRSKSDHMASVAGCSCNMQAVAVNSGWCVCPMHTCLESWQEGKALNAPRFVRFAPA